MRMTKVAAALVMLAAGSPALAGTYQKTATGVDVRPDAGAAALVRLNVMGGNIVRSPARAAAVRSRSARRGRRRSC
jgi:alpha-D-xyloside xylohydrolase